MRFAEWDVFIVVAALLPSFALGQAGIRCRRENGDILCEFQLPGEGSIDKLDLSHCLDNDVCVEAQVVVKRKDDSLVDNSGIVEQEPNTQQSIAAVVAETPTTVEVAGKTYSEPFSQYGPAIAEALRSRPTSTRSWRYTDWLNEFAIALRGDPESLSSQLESADPVAIENAVAVLELAVKMSIDLEGSGLGDAKISIAHSYMTMAETYIFDPYNPQYDEALKYFELSNRLFHELIVENDFPLGITRADIELNWADTLVRIAIVSVEKQMGDQQTETDHYGMGADGGDLSNFEVNSLTGGSMMDSKTAEVVDRSEEMLSDAVASFRQLVIEAKNPTQAVLRKTRLANALQNLASISAMTGSDFEATNHLLEEAVALYTSSLNDLDASNPERRNAISGVAELLYSLSDGYLQAAKYEQAKARYRDTVNWYKTYNLAPPEVSELAIMDADDALESAEQKLQAYTTMLYGGGELQIPNDNTRRGEAVYEADELYEADLHATLGALRMARNEMHLAVIHLAEAIQRYGRYPESGRSLADAKLNLAMAYFKQGEYELSIEAHEDALDDYKRVVPEGKNPLMDGFEDLFEQQGVNRDTLKAGTSAGDTNHVIDVSAYQASILNRTVASKDEL
ncbi:hypothetical protein MHU86_21783 [Fragilaria crotonensis]|nr:hypothetical protein MHU86_21783 [Fragilaria crotonensis]